MNILSGKFKGRKLANCKTGSIRQAMALVRKSIFDSLQDFVVGINVLDLCAGTGALGIEALSRGADKLTLIDADKDSIRLIFKNLDLCKVRATVILGSLPKVLNKPKVKSEKYDLIFLDPPYGQGQFIEEVLKVITLNDLLKRTGIVSIEHEAKCRFLIPEQLTSHKTKKYGNTMITFLRYNTNQ